MGYVLSIVQSLRCNVCLWNSYLFQLTVPADLADTVGGLDAELEWSHVLSLGEQQRVAFLRLLLHQPAMAFLDEATGALDSATEASCYRALHKHSTSFVSVGECCLCLAGLAELASSPGCAVA